VGTGAETRVLGTQKRDDEGWGWPGRWAPCRAATKPPGAHGDVDEATVAAVAEAQRGVTQGAGGPIFAKHERPAPQYHPGTGQPLDAGDGGPDGEQRCPGACGDAALNSDE